MAVRKKVQTKFQEHQNMEKLKGNEDVKNVCELCNSLNEISTSPVKCVVIYSELFGNSDLLFTILNHVLQQSSQSIFHLVFYNHLIHASLSVCWSVIESCKYNFYFPFREILTVYA